jgi:hypothetical protein
LNVIVLRQSTRNHRSFDELRTGAEYGDDFHCRMLQIEKV